MPDWIVKFTQRLATFKPGWRYGIIITIDNKHGVDWSVQELGKVERAWANESSS